MSTVPPVTRPSSDADPTLSPRPRAATGPGSPLRSEVSRLLHRRLVLALLAAGVVALVVAAVALFATHSTDVQGARVSAQAEYDRYVTDTRQSRERCLNDPAIPDDQRAMMCGPAPQEDLTTADSFFTDPRLRADQGLPGLAIGVTVVGGMLFALIGATATGADWSSRTMVSLLTWQPRRLRFLGTRLGAIALLAAVVGVLAQVMALGLGSLVVTARGSWTPTPEISSDGMLVGGVGEALLPAEHFWRDLLSLQGRGVLLTVLAAVVAAALATITRSTGGFLGVALGWLVLVEGAGQALLFNQLPSLLPWTLTQSVTAAILPGGSSVYLGDQIVNGQLTSRTVLVTNLDGLGHLGLLAVVVIAVAAVLLRRRDL